MVEELKDASDIKKLIGKNKGEEDPLLVAQRFLNIFRQLHIFDQQRRDEFNSLILALSPEIRGSFGILPGGSVLQEYVDELELSKGLVKSNNAAIPTSLINRNSEKESPLAKIKNAQQQNAGNASPIAFTGEAKVVADASFAQVLSQSVSSALMSANASKNADFDKLIEAIKENASNAKFAPDDKFAATMARAFSQALQYSDAGKKADIKELINAVKESRKIELPEGAFSSASSAPLIENQEAFAKSIALAVSAAVKSTGNNISLGNELKELVEAIKESRKIELPSDWLKSTNISNPSQVPLIANEEAFAKSLADAMAKSTANATPSALSANDIKLLAESLKGNSSIDVDALSQAMVNGLKPLLSSLSNNSTNKNSTQNITTNADANLADIISRSFAQTFEISEKKHQQQTERLIAGFQDIIQKEYSNKQTKQTNNSNVASPVISNVGLDSDKLEKITQDFTRTLKSINDSRKSENKEISQAIKDTSKEIGKLLTQNSQSSNKSISSAADKEMINEIITKVAQAQSNIFQEMAKQQTNELSNIISLALKESHKSSVDTIVDIVKSLQSNGIKLSENIPAIEESNNNDNGEYKSFIQRTAEAALQDDFTEEKNINKSVKEKKSNVAKYIKSTFERIPIEEDIRPSSSDWGFNEDKQDETDDFFATEVPISEENNEDWEWEYEEVADDNTNGVEGEDWEWEYEEPATANFQGVEGQDWEWEYDESAEADFQGVEGEDWEWEYEEDDEEAVENLNINSADGAINNTASEVSADSEINTQENMTNITDIDIATPEELSPISDVEKKIIIPPAEIMIAELRNPKTVNDPYLNGDIVA